MTPSTRRRSRRPMPHPPRPAHDARRAGFSLLELVVVVLLLAIVAGVVAPRVTDRKAAARDARRLADLRVVAEAIERYRADHGTYPPAHKSDSYGGWDVSHDGNFIPELLRGGYLDEMPRDPVNDSTFHYRYYVYGQGSYGCKGSGPFYVLGIKHFETRRAREDHDEGFRCSSRDWGNEFDHVVGQGARYK